MENKLIEMKAVIAAGMMAIGAVLGWKGLMVLTWVFLLALDYLTGSFAAMKAGEWSSKKAREGIWHKAGAMVVVIVAAITDGILLVMCGNIPILNITYPGLVLPLSLAWYILTELGSILENAIKLDANPPVWLKKAIQVGVDAVEAAGKQRE